MSTMRLATDEDRCQLASFHIAEVDVSEVVWVQEFAAHEVDFADMLPANEEWMPVKLTMRPSGNVVEAQARLRSDGSVEVQAASGSGTAVIKLIGQP